MYKRNNENADAIDSLDDIPKTKLFNTEIDEPKSHQYIS